MNQEPIYLVSPVEGPDLDDATFMAVVIYPEDYLLLTAEA